MKPPYASPEALSQFIQNALDEDLSTGKGAGDHSSLAAVPKSSISQAQLKVKSEGILAGVELASEIFSKVDPQLSVEYFYHDGDRVETGGIGFMVEGAARSILKAERLVLNCMQRMSGIATKTHQMSQLISHTKAKLLDTRKTTPNFRIPEKWAVEIGGGANHRLGLYDMIMLKDNHIDFAGGIKEAISATRTYLRASGLDLKVEVETRNLLEVERVLETGHVDVIMLDNMTPEKMAEAVRLISGRMKTEASGGITEQTIKEVAETGVDFISVGALTHSYQSLDLSLKAVI